MIGYPSSGAWALVIGLQGLQVKYLPARDDRVLGFLGPLACSASLPSWPPLGCLPTYNKAPAYCRGS